jgi:hypothetical protein
MQNKNTTFKQIIVIAALFLTACAANVQLDQTVEPARNLDLETFDLAEVTADAINLAEQHGKENVLVVFDIDNTILAMEQDLGADQWYEWQKDLNENDRCNPQNVGDRFAVQGALYFANAMRKTQEDGAYQVGKIQNLGVKVIALTSRGPDFRLPTFRELRRNGYSFSHSALGSTGGYGKPFLPVENGRLSLYEDGVFFTAGQHKGQMLFALLEKTGTPMPDVIIMTDDKRKNLDDITETFSALNVPVHAWRYSAEDGSVNDFDPERANAQWESIEGALRQIQEVLGPDNYDLSSAVKPTECH